jgi:GT2 family glycosyltransferase
MKKIAVVILNWNGVKLLEQFLPSVIQFSPEATIYVADNASTDSSVEFIKKEFPSIKIIENSDNFGFAKGYNEALVSVEEEYYALVNSDIEVTENWLQPILELFEKDPKTGIIQPKILDYKNKKMFEYAGAAGGYIDKYGYPYCRGRFFDTIEEDINQYSEITEIFWASGACLFIRKNIFRELNGFDTDFFAHQEEIDLCWRAYNKGYIAKYCPESRVYHVGGATLQTGSPMKTFLNFRNSLWMLTKNLPKNELVPVLFIRMVLDGVAGVKFLAEGKPKLLWAILRAHFYFYTNFLKFYYKRNSVQKGNYFSKKSIVFEYYLNKKKKFSDL